MKLVRTAGLCIVVLALAVTGFAQTQITTGVIQGTVMDQSGAVMQGARVEAKESATNFTKNQSTNANGRFIFLAMPPGRYTLTISQSGFSTIVQENLDLLVGQAINLNFNMKVSATAERIVVTETPTVDTSETENATTLNQTTVSTTPILGRKFEDLLTLTPGVSIVQGPDGDEITFAGQRGIFNNISLDGGDYNNGFFGEQMGGQRAAIDITLDAVREFQVVANGANAEFGRTAGGVVNVITKSGTNDLHGSAYEFFRHKALSSDTSDGKPLDGFYRDQFGGTIGGPIVKDKMFFFAGVESIFADLRRANLSAPIGPTACPFAAPVVTDPAQEAAINSNEDCQRLALIGFMQSNRGQAEGLPVKHPIRNTAVLGKWDWNVSAKHKLGVSYNFDYSKNTNQTFDVPTYGDSADGIEGPSKIQAINANLFSTLSAKKLNEFHFTYSRENRPRSATPSNIPADTAIGGLNGDAFRFGNPFFLAPNIDELFWRTQVRDNVSLIQGSHTIKFGGEWLHSRNIQVFRGFFQGYYIFGSVDGFLHYASPASTGPGYGPSAVQCADGTFVSSPAPCADGSTPFSPLFLYLQAAGLTGKATDAAGASNIANEDYALFIQDTWKVTSRLTVNYGLRWEAQTFPDPVIPPAQTAYGPFLNNPLFPSDGTIHNQWKEFQPRLGFAWDITGRQKSVLRGNAGIFNARQNMLTEVSAITTNGVQQQTLVGGTPLWPGVIDTIPPPPPGQNAPDFSGVHVFPRNYANPRIYTGNLAFEQELASSLSAYIDFTWSKGVHLTQFLNGNNPTTISGAPGGFFLPNGTFVPGGTFSPLLGDLWIHAPTGKSLYRGLTIGMKKRFSRHWQGEWNYVLSEDLDNDSNERDPFTDHRINPRFPPADYSFSDRDERHKFNLFGYGELPHSFNVDLRLQAHTPQPITPGSCLASPLTAPAGCRNSAWKDNAYISFDWRVMRPFKIGDRYQIIPMAEMFNTFNNVNNVNTLSKPLLFDFDGFIRQGVGDPRELQLALRFTF
jgi:Carboxypeptidase regulatory-like domain